MKSIYTSTQVGGLQQEEADHWGHVGGVEQARANGPIVIVGNGGQQEALCSPKGDIRAKLSYTASDWGGSSLSSETHQHDWCD